MQTLSQEQFKQKYGERAVMKFEQMDQNRFSQSPQAPVNTNPISNRITEALGLGGATDVFGKLLARAGVGGQNEGQKRVSELTGMSQAEINRTNIQAPTGTEIAGATIQTAAIPAGIIVTGGGSLAGQVAAGGALGYLYDVGSDLAEGKQVSDSLTPGGATAIGLATPPAIKALTGAVKGASGLLSTSKKAIESIPTPEVPSGIKQIGSEIAERVPRAIEKGQTMLDEATVRAERIKNAPPVVQQAIKSGLDDVIITSVEQADEPTKRAFKQMVEIAETPRTSLRPNVKPSSVAGEAVSEQYDILNKTRQSVGQQIGDAVDALSNKGATVDVLPQQRQIRDLLRQNGILPDASGQLKFTGSPLTPKQQTLVQQLYELATQTETMTPRQVYNYDKLFSQLQREARFDGLDNVFLSTPEGEINVYRAFRNIFSNKLDEIAPEIAPLNREYAQLRNLQDDIESSIVKRGNFESTRNVDAAEFAQTNLRRIFSDAQSAADYRALADKLDALARGKGYTGANPQDLAGFAERLRSIYPETTPETSFRGGITTSIKDALGKVLDIGKPDVADQQKAIRALLDIPETTPNTRR